MKKYKISIVIPSYNQGQYLEETILSIITQTYDNYEILFIDGGSCDNTLSIIKKYENYIDYWISEKDNGQSHAINKALELATGDIVNWLNSDDLLEENALFNIAHHYKNSEPDVICGYCDYFKDDTGSPYFRHRTHLCNRLENTLLRGEINQPSTFYKLSVVKDLGGLNPSLHCVMDLDLFYKYLLNYGQKNILLTEDVYSRYRDHENTKTSTLQEKFMQERNILMNTVISKFTIPAYVKKSLQDSSETSFNYAINKKNINFNSLLIAIYENNIFRVYNNRDYLSVLYILASLLLSSKRVYTRTHIGIFIRSCYNLLK